MRPAPVVAVPLVLVPALGLAQGGFSPDAWVWAGALAAWGTAIAVVLSDDAGALASAWLWACLAAGLLCWTLASTLWSAHAAQSVLDARRTGCYAAVLLALVTLTRRGSTRMLVLATHAAVTAVVLYALARYLIGPHRQREFEDYLLSEPLGYANAVGILAVLGIVLGLGVAARATSKGRAAATATVPPLAAALELSGSRASWPALAVGLGVALLLDDAPTRILRTLAAVAAPSAVLVVLARVSDLSTLPQPRFDGWVLALATVACGLAAAGLADAVATLSLPRWKPTRRLVTAVAVTGLGLAIAAGAAYVSSTEPRATYYSVSWHAEYAAHPLLGSGAGTFALYWDRSGHVASRGGALDAHSLYLETLAELGPLGLVLLLASLLYPVRAAVSGRRAAYVPAAAGAYVAFLFHAGVDWDWEMPVVVVAALACAAATVSSSVTTRRTLSTLARAGVLVVAVALGAFAIAGARSQTRPEAARPTKREAPPKQGPSSSFRAGIAYDLPWWPLSSPLP